MPTDKNRACPHCESHNLKRWVMGKIKCGQCERVYYPQQLLLKKYVPKKKRNPRRESDKQEIRNARRVRGTRTIASGSTPVDKADVKADVVRMECKTTGNKSYRLKKDDFIKLQSQAKDGEMPVFAIEFRDGASPFQVFVIDEGWYLQIVEMLRRDRDDS